MSKTKREINKGEQGRSKIETAGTAQRLQLCLTVSSWTATHQAPLSMGFSRQDTGMGCHALFQEIFLTQGLSPRLLLHRRWILYHCTAWESQNRQRHLQREISSKDDLRLIKVKVFVSKDYM